MKLFCIASLFVTNYILTRGQQRYRMSVTCFCTRENKAAEKLWKKEEHVWDGDAVFYQYIIVK